MRLTVKAPRSRSCHLATLSWPRTALSRPFPSTPKRRTSSASATRMETSTSSRWSIEHIATLFSLLSCKALHHPTYKWRAEAVVLAQNEFHIYLFQADAVTRTLRRTVALRGCGWIIPGIHFLASLPSSVAYKMTNFGMWGTCKQSAPNFPAKGSESTSYLPLVLTDLHITTKFMPSLCSFRVASST